MQHPDITRRMPQHRYAQIDVEGSIKSGVKSSSLPVAGRARIGDHNVGVSQAGNQLGDLPTISQIAHENCCVATPQRHRLKRFLASVGKG
jgi:hypothetical protein